MSLMSCLQAAFSRIGGMTATFQKEGGRLICSASREHCNFSFDRIETGFDATALKKSGMTVSFGLVCTVGMEEYVLWARDGMVLNVHGDKIYLTRKS